MSGHHSGYVFIYVILVMDMEVKDTLIDLHEVDKQEKSTMMKGQMVVRYFIMMIILSGKKAEQTIDREKFCWHKRERDGCSAVGKNEMLYMDKVNKADTGDLGSNSYFGHLIKWITKVIQCIHICRIVSGNVSELEMLRIPSVYICICEQFYFKFILRYITILI